VCVGGGGSVLQKMSVKCSTFIIYEIKASLYIYSGWKNTLEDPIGNEGTRRIGTKASKKKIVLPVL
jgi:hypothetical protein